MGLTAVEIKSSQSFVTKQNIKIIIAFLFVLTSKLYLIYVHQISFLSLQYLPNNESTPCSALHHKEYSS